MVLFAVDSTDHRLDVQSLISDGEPHGDGGCCFRSLLVEAVDLGNHLTVVAVVHHVVELRDTEAPVVGAGVAVARGLHARHGAICCGAGAAARYLKERGSHGSDRGEFGEALVRLDDDGVNGSTCRERTQGRERRQRG